MKALSWTFAEPMDPIAIAEELRKLFLPLELVIDYQDGYARQIEKLTKIIEATGDSRGKMPLQVIRANSTQWGPHHGVKLVVGATSIEGFVSKYEICVVVKDTVDEEVAETVRRTCGRIKGATPKQFEKG
jgi:hypothetical protein